MSAPKYNLVEDYVNVQSSSPAWVLAVWRLALPISFDRSEFKSVSGMPGDGVKLRGQNPLIVYGDCAQLSVNTNKASHTPMLSATLNAARINYLVEILPGDWVAAWMFNNETDAEAIIKKLQKGEACNDFASGFKFIGQVDSMQNSGSVSPDGKISSEYSLSARAFTALDNSVFYDINLAESNLDSIPKWMAKVGKDLTALFGDLKQNEDNSAIIMTQVLEIILGSGFPEKWANQGHKDGVNNMYNYTDGKGGESGQEAKYANLVPESVGKVLGRSSRNDKGGYLAYPDIMECIFGVQKFESNNASDPWARMTPTLDRKSDRTYKFCKDTLLGSYLPVGIVFMNKPIWSILMEFLNYHINELYVTFKTNENGKILPTLTARQIPFTTESFNDTEATTKHGNGGTGSGLAAGAAGTGLSGNTKKFTYTKFLSLPRWVVDPVIVRSWSIGRSNATRTNLVYVYGQSRLGSTFPVYGQIVQNPPIYDSLDIQRSGTKIFQGNTACELNDQLGAAPTVWMRLIADRMMGSHLTVNGSLTLVGVQSPICIGDNLEWNGVVYHIESITHTCGMSGDKKLFSTSLQLTNGLRNLDDDRPTKYTSSSGSGGGEGSGSMTFQLNQNDKIDPEYTRSSDFPIYAGISIEDNMKYQPGVTEFNRVITDADIKEAGETEPPPTVKPPGNNSPSSYQRGTNKIVGE